MQIRRERGEKREEGKKRQKGPPRDQCYITAGDSTESAPRPSGHSIKEEELIDHEKKKKTRGGKGWPMGED